MAKNITLEIIDRLQKLEVAQGILAAEKVAAAALNGETITLAQATAPTVVNRIIKELPTGLCNGVNKIFTLVKVPVFKTEEVYMSGCLLRRGPNADYTLEAGSKILIMNYEPESDDVIEISYDFVLNGN